MLETELYILTGQVKPEAFIFSQPSPLETGRDTKRTYIMPRKQSRIVEIVRWLKRVTIWSNESSGLQTTGWAGGSQRQLGK